MRPILNSVSRRTGMLLTAALLGGLVLGAPAAGAEPTPTITPTASSTPTVVPTPTPTPTPTATETPTPSPTPTATPSPTPTPPAPTAVPTPERADAATATLRIRAGVSKGVTAEVFAVGSDEVLAGDAAAPFEFVGLPAGAYQVRYTRAGYPAPQWSSSSFMPWSSREGSRVFALAAGESREVTEEPSFSREAVTGVVRLEGGAPAAGVTVRVDAFGYGVDPEYRDPVVGAVTAADGSFTLSNLWGWAPVVVVTAPTGYQSTTVDFTTVTGGTADLGELVLRENALGTVEGLVTSADTGSPIPGAEVRLELYDYDPDADGGWLLGAGTTTGADGRYSATAVIPDFGDEPVSGRVTVSAAGFAPSTTPVDLFDGVPVTVDAVLVPRATLSGTITGTTVSGEQVPAVGATITAHQIIGDRVRGSRTAAVDSAGRYTIDLDPGEYVFTFGGSWAPELWADRPYNPVGDASSLARLGDRMTLAAGQTAVLDAAVAAYGGIAGTVTDDAGVPIAGATIQLSNVVSYISDRTTDADGSYSFAAVPNGTYQFSVRVAGHVVPATALVTIVDGVLLTRDLQLTRLGSVTGVVITDAGAGARSVAVRLEPIGDGRAATATSNGAGRYTFDGVQPGDYTLEFATDSRTPLLRGEFWQDSPTRAGATAITVAPGSATTLPTAELAAAGAVTISGAHPRAPIFALYRADGTVVARATGQVATATTFGNLESGSYYLRAIAAGSNGDPDGGHAWYGGATLAGATPLVVRAGERVTVSFDTPSLVAVSGVVRDSAGTPVRNAVVRWRAVGEVPGDETALRGMTGTVTTGADGRYRLSASPGGIRVTATLDGRTTAWTADGGSDVLTVRPGAPLTGIDLVFTNAGTVTGTATVGEVIPVPATAVVFVSLSGQDVASATPDVNGRYSRPALPSGDYKVRIDSAVAGGVRAQWSGGGDTFATAATITVVADGTQVLDLSAKYARSEVGGVITDPSGAPEADVAVQVFAAGTRRPVGATATDDQGRWSVRLASVGGPYQVKFVPLDRDLGPVWWDAQSIRRTAGSFELGAAASRVDLDASLPDAAGLTGLVVDDAGAPLAGVPVLAYATGKVRVQTRETDAEGRYVFDALPSEVYAVKAIPGGALAPGWTGSVPTGAGAHVDLGTLTLARAATIGGTVRDGSGHGIGGVRVEAVVDGARIATVRTGADGSYALAGLPAAAYTVRFFAAGAPTHWYSVSPDGVTPSPIAVVAGENRSGIDIVIEDADVTDNR